VLIYVHKEEELADVEHWFPAEHYVLIDDKLRILDAVKNIWGDRVTTVFPRQGHYALDPNILAAYPPPDLAIDHIGDLLQYDLAAFRRHGADDRSLQKAGTKPNPGHPATGATPCATPPRAVRHNIQGYFAPAERTKRNGTNSRCAVTPSISQQLAAEARSAAQE